MNIASRHMEIDVITFLCVMMCIIWEIKEFTYSFYQRQSVVFFANKNNIMKISDLNQDMGTRIKILGSCLDNFDKLFEKV